MTKKSEIYQRYKKILQALSQKSELTNEEIKNKLGGEIKDKIVWQDLKVLSQMGLIEKIHGGARSNTHVKKRTEFYRHLEKNVDDKKNIAQLVIDQFLKQCNAGAKICIYLDSGSTNLILYQEIIKNAFLKRIDIKIVSNNISLTHEACPDNVTLIISGGRYSNQDECFLDDRASEIFQNYPARYAFLSTSNLSYQGGLLGYNPGEKKVKEEMIKNAENVFILADSSKFHFFTGGELIAKFDWSKDNLKSLNLIPVDKSSITKPVKIITNRFGDNEVGVLKGFIDSEKGITERDVRRFILFAKEKP